MAEESSTAQQEEMEFVQGEILRTLFRNQDNGYSVLHLKPEEASFAPKEKQITVVGSFPSLEEEETYCFYGGLIEHPVYGVQFKAEQFERVMPTGVDAVIQYLASDRFPGIGRKTAEAVVGALGDTAVQKILADPACLQKVEGLKEQKQKQIHDTLMENQGMERAMIYLTQHGFGLDLATRIYNTYEEETLEKVQADPYQLVWDVEGIGFYKADMLGRELGIDPLDAERLKAGLMYSLYEKSMQEGHVYYPEGELVEETYQLLAAHTPELTKEHLLQAIVELAEESKLAVDETRVYLPSLYFAEKGFVTHISRLMEQAEDEEGLEEAAFLEALGETEERFDMTYADKQHEAIRTAIENPLMILTGGPGTGKTTVIQAIVDIYARLEGFSLEPADYKKEPFPVLLAAPTGRAAKRMKETTGLPAYTIHRLLGYKGTEAEDEPLEHHEENPLAGHVLIIDEVSMVDMWLMNQLFRAIPDGMKVILVGDEDQLPSVGPGEVLGDLLEANVLPAVALSVVYRQAEGSSIIDMAHHLKAGEMPDDLAEPKSDRRFFDCQTEQVIAVVERVCSGAVNRGYTAKEIQVLAPMYKGPAGINTLNERLQALFNPEKEGRREVAHGEATYRTGDMVLQLVNVPEEGIYNGDRGEIVAIFKANETADKKMQIVISFEGKEITYEKKDLNQITLAYCSSIHKAQGSEFPIVIAPVVMAYRRMLKRNLIYTGITRAKEYLILCGEMKALDYAIRTKTSGNRYTRLVSLLADRMESSPIHEKTIGGAD
ncbi:ATP-dependent RecD-like DNA helicase [Salsuginibacillus kocurii]|uniref:SF1B family DNA helicase RecD2 n=1 Tax=Salsuginibacillus kocurii TaxID=427078 RepID=UPI000379DABB|nr:ATP-dependent RecD-like DNA helicase [Salsuginibacillus kocurii]